MKLFAASLSARPCAHGRACICSRSEGLRATAFFVFFPAPARARLVASNFHHMYWFGLAIFTVFRIGGLQLGTYLHKPLCFGWLSHFLIQIDEPFNYVYAISQPASSITGEQYFFRFLVLRIPAVEPAAFSPAAICPPAVGVFPYPFLKYLFAAGFVARPVMR